MERIKNWEGTRKSRCMVSAAAVLIGLWVIQLTLLVLTALIPQSAIEENMVKAGDYYGSRDDFQLLWEADSPGLIHYYADALLLNIIWNQDSSHPLRSAIDGAYYESEPGSDVSRCTDLGRTVAGGEANREYARYWHGMGVVLKPLLCVMTIQQIGVLGAVVLAALGGLCLVLLWRRGRRAAAVALALSLIMVRIWIVPMCIEYYACFALMFAGADIILLKKDSMKRPWLLFVALGALVCFFDFLTCEILTLGLPLIVLLLVRDEDRRTSLRTTALCSGSWLIGYSLTWLCKWSLSAVVLGQSIRDIAIGQGLYRAAGEFGVTVDYGAKPVAANVVNLSMLQPFQALEKAPKIMVAFSALVLILFSLWYLFRKKENGPALALLLVGLLPFVRFALICNHAALHPFMTYRDLLLTMVGVSLAMVLSMGRPEKQTGTRRKR